MSKILIIGGGHQGLAMAAHLALNNEEIYLWNRTENNIKEIIEEKKIYCNGVCSGIANIVKASSNIEEVYQDYIMVTTPSSAHRDIAKTLAPYINENTTIILNPGRTFGVIEFIDVLQENGCKILPAIAETQTIVYTCRRNNKNEVNIYKLKKGVKMASYIPEQIDEIMDKLPFVLKQYFVKSDSIIETSLGNIGAILHPTPTILNTGWIENSVTKFKYYYDGITPTIAQYIQKIDEERTKIAKGLGYDLESTIEWLKRIYFVSGDNLYECISNNEYYKDIDAPTTINHRYIDEDVPFGLVPMEQTAKLLNIETPYITQIINMSSLLMGKDYREIGRNIDINKYLRKIKKRNR